METISVCNYKDISNTRNRQNGGHLQGNTRFKSIPFVQNGSLNKILIFTLPMGNLDLQELGNLITSIVTPKVVSVNFEANVPVDEEVYVEIYEDINELAKISTALALYNCVKLPREFMDSVFENKIIKAINEFGGDIELARTGYNAVLDYATKVHEYELTNVFDIINLTEREECLGVVAHLRDFLLKLSQDVLSFKCSIKELVTLMHGDLGLYLRFFIKSIQLNVKQSDLTGCVGITEAPLSLIPLFNTAGIVDDCFNYLNAEPNIKIGAILEQLNVEDITSYNNLMSTIMQNCLGLPIEDTKHTVTVVVHELANVLLKKREFLGNDMYKILVEQALKKFNT